MSELRGLVFADLHLRDRGSFPPFHKVSSNGLTLELNNILSGLRWAAQRIQHFKPHAVWLAGDVFDVPEFVTTTVLHAASIGLDAIKSACRSVGAEFYIIPGNHDTQNDNVGIYSVSVLRGFGKVVTHDRTLEIRGHKIGVVQFHSDKVGAYERLKASAKNHDLIITHMDFKSAYYDNGTRSKSALPSKYGVPVISGDLHLAQTFDDISYPGSLVQNRFSRNDLAKAGGTLEFTLRRSGFSAKHEMNTSSRHYVRVDDLKAIDRLDPKTCVLQVKVHDLDDTHRKILDKNFSWYYVPVRKELVTESESVATDRSSPLESLAEFVAKQRPRASFVVSALSRLESK